MRFAFVLPAALALLAGCEGNPDKVESTPSHWQLPGPDFERQVFGPLQLDEVEGFVREKESQGWELVGFTPASPPEVLMVNAVELDRPGAERVSREKGPVLPRDPGRWTSDVPKSHVSVFLPPAPKKARDKEGNVTPDLVDSIPPYLEEGVRSHRQKYLISMRRWL